MRHLPARVFHSRHKGQRGGIDSNKRILFTVKKENVFFFVLFFSLMRLVRAQSLPFNIPLRVAFSQQR